MSLWELISNHKHYWGVPHSRDKDEKLIQICYDCGKIRAVIADIRPGE